MKHYHRSRLPRAGWPLVCVLALLALIIAAPASALPTVSIANTKNGVEATPNVIPDMPILGRLTVTRSGDGNVGDLTVKYLIKNTSQAKPGVRYTIPDLVINADTSANGTIVIPNGSATAQIVYTPINDDIYQGPLLNIYVDLVDDAAYTVGTRSAITKLDCDDPRAPENLTATMLSPTQIQLNWVRNQTAGYTSTACTEYDYSVETLGTNGQFIVLATVLKNADQAYVYSYTATITAGSVNTFRIRARYRRVVGAYIYYNHSYPSNLVTIPDPVVPIAASGIPGMTIRIPTTASTDLQSTATKLAANLNQMVGGVFTVAMFDPAVGPGPGIILGKGSDLNLTDEVPDPGAALKTREHYLLCTANNNAYIVLAGATDLAIRDAVYDFLERLGCRWYLTNANWTIIPSAPDLSWATPPLLHGKSVTMGTQTLYLNIFADETPHFKSRDIFNGYEGSVTEWLQQKNDWFTWCERNRFVKPGLNIMAQHNYTFIIQWAQARGRWNNDYYALVDGVRRTDGQFCIANPGLQQVVVDYAVDYLATHPTADSVSLEPRDNHYWCECAGCQAIQNKDTTGFVTDRVIFLNNLAAAAIPDGKYIGMNAYAMHAGPPTLTVSDKIYVFIATSFLSQGYTIDSLIAAWRQKAQNIGILDYFDVYVWNYNLPGKAKGARLGYLQTKYPYYYANNADVCIVENSHADGPQGLGVYAASKLTWDTGTDVGALQDEFLTRCFGPAAEPLREFYLRLDPGNNYLLGSDLMGRLYRYLHEARALTTDPSIVARLDDLTLYLRYVELRRAYTVASGAQHQALGEQILRYVWKIRNSNMVDSLAIWITFDDQWPLDGNGNPMKWTVPYPTHPWKEAGTYTHDEIVQMNLDGITNNPLLPEEPKSFSDDLVPSGGSAGTRGALGRIYGTRYFFLRGNTAGTLPTLNITNGLTWQNRGNATWSLYTADGQTLLESGTVPPDKVAHAVSFTTTGTGNYQFVYNDGGGGSVFTWTAGSKVTMCADMARPFHAYSSHTRLYFYVPKGTNHVMINFQSLGTSARFYTAAGTLKLQAPPAGDIVIPVGAGEDDQIWYMTSILSEGGFRFLNTPGFIALRQDELLIPREAFANLVPSGQAASTRGTLGTLRGAATVFLRTGTGGSLPSLTITNGQLDQGVENATWALYSEDGKTLLQSGTVAPDQTAHVVAFTNPAVAGTYLFTYNDQGGGSTVTWTAGGMVTFAADQNRMFTSTSATTRAYFFVPKGTQLVTFMADACTPCQFYDATGTLVSSFAGGTNGSVAVGAGQDGQIWSVTGLSATNLRFLTVPGGLALNKDELLVPHWTLVE